MPSTATQSRAPRIPNHEMVRSIGRGSYGEIWLARSLTGTWRAVKIVDRRTFESDKAFQREFEGITKFEPISRDDAGFVDILHVGRDEAGGFFYYVMELADDHLGRGAIDPARYVPKTIKAELARRARLLADECITIGLSLTRALGALHRQGLVHRDIKPANVIFVGGVPKIADIGLVAASGQDSYVGTEGYVPPEGPGTAQADLYSLGKVLYEMAMGKDRLDFPAVNSALAELPDRAALLRLNPVLLRACASDPGARYATAEEMHDDLERLRDGKALGARWRGRTPVFVSVAAVALLGSGGWMAMRQQQARGGIRIETSPPGAMIVIGDKMRRSPAEFSELRPGKYGGRVMLSGYEPAETFFEIKGGQQAAPPPLKLVRARGAAQIASQPAGATYELRQGEELVRRGDTPATIPDLPTGEYQLVVKLEGRTRREALEIKRGEVTMRAVEFASGVLVVKSEPAGADILLNGQPAGKTPLELRAAEGEHELIARYRAWPEQRRRVRATPAQPAEAAFEFAPGSVKITSAPGGASVWQGGRELGRTTLQLEDLEPGAVRYELRLAGFKNLEAAGQVEPGKQTFLLARFLKRIGPRSGEPWENGLGMKFVPVGEVLMAVWPTRVQDYDRFCEAAAHPRPSPGFGQTALHPVVGVSWEDADAFCRWLTQKERADGRLEDGQSYRLPTDREWSAGGGLPEEGRATPQERETVRSEFPWGRQWPPPAGAGNLADAAARRTVPAVIAGYQDGFAQSSPVGSFPANAQGLFDMCGNAWQWCRDSYAGAAATRMRDLGVLRGGSWATAERAQLRTSYRNVVHRADRDPLYGFRCVLALEPEG